MLRPGPVIITLWAVFWISWLVSAGWSAKTERRVGMKGELAYRIVLIAGALAMKARLEEGWLRQELDPGAYDDYRRKVPMLLPFGPR